VSFACPTLCQNGSGLYLEGLQARRRYVITLITAVVPTLGTPPGRTLGTPFKNDQLQDPTSGCSRVFTCLDAAEPEGSTKSVVARTVLDDA
jgi:hypothetical protein